MVRGCFTALGSHSCTSAWKVTLQSGMLPFLIMRIEKSWIKCCDFWKEWVSIYVCFVKGMEIPLFPFMLFLPGWVGNPFFSGRPRKRVSHKTGAWSMGSILLILVTLRTNTKRTIHQKGSMWHLLLFEDTKDTSQLKGDTTLGYVGGKVTRFWPSEVRGDWSSIPWPYLSTKETSICHKKRFPVLADYGNTEIWAYFMPFIFFLL